MEYVHPSEIREVLLEIAPHMEDLLSLPDQELMDEYTKWYMACKKAGKSSSEMCLPDML
jgi:hypothetical protein